MLCNSEILGLNSLTLYYSNEVGFLRPVIAVEDEVDIYVTDDNVVISNSASPKWSREIDYSGNYRQSYQDKFSFYVHGINDTTAELLTKLRSNRVGFNVLAYLNDGQKFIFPSPVFVSEIYKKAEDLRTWKVELSYHLQVFSDKLKVLNIYNNGWDFIDGVDLEFIDNVSADFLTE